MPYSFEITKVHLCNIRAVISRMLIRLQQTLRLSLPTPPVGDLPRAPVISRRHKRSFLSNFPLPVVVATPFFLVCARAREEPPCIVIPGQRGPAASLPSSAFLHWRGEGGGDKKGGKPTGWRRLVAERGAKAK